MKKYVKPMMESEVFITNEFVGACDDGSHKYVCLNMGEHSKSFSVIYKDDNGNGIKENNETTIWNASYKDDCGETGGRVHSITDPSKLTKVLIHFNSDPEGVYTSAYAVPVGGNSYHYVSVKTFNAS